MISRPTTSTRNFLTFANTTAIAYRQNLEAPVNFWRYAIAVVFANVRKLRVLPAYILGVRRVSGGWPELGKTKRSHWISFFFLLLPRFSTLTIIVIIIEDYYSQALTRGNKLCHQLYE